MSLKRLWAILKARNLEFFRDRSAFGWNFFFPFLLVAGFGIIFGGKTYTEYKIGVFPAETNQVSIAEVWQSDLAIVTRNHQGAGCNLDRHDGTLEQDQGKL